jgi:hypothetical protein
VQLESEASLAGAVSVRGRAAHAATRTLSFVSRSLRARRHPRLALAALVLVGTSLAGFALQQRARSGAAALAALPYSAPALAAEQGNEMALLHATPERAAVVAEPEVQVLSAGGQGVRPTSVAFGSEPSSAPLNFERRRVAGSAAQAQAVVTRGRPPTASAAAARKGVTPAAPAAPALGANRSPIIE